MAPSLNQSYKFGMQYYQIINTSNISVYMSVITFSIGYKKTEHRIGFE